MILEIKNKSINLGLKSRLGLGYIKKTLQRPLEIMKLVVQFSEFP